MVLAASVSAVAVLAGGAGRSGGGAARVSSAEALFEQMMASNARAARLAATAVARSCQEAAPGTPSRAVSLADLARVVTLRQSVLNTLGTNQSELLAMPDGELLVTDLSQATNAELTVDKDQRGWLQDLQATGCYSAPTNDIDYRAASVAVPAAVEAGQRLVTAWAKVDPTARSPR